MAKALKQALQLDGELQEDEVCGGRGTWEQTPCTGPKGLPDCCALSRYLSHRDWGMGMWGRDIGHGEVLFGTFSLRTCPGLRAITCWGEAGAGSNPEPFRPCPLGPIPGGRGPLHLCSC